MSAHFGFNEFALEALRMAFAKKHINYRYCSLMWDEITFSPELKFNKSTYQLNGFVGDSFLDDEDVEFDPRLADHALVFIVLPYMGDWIQPVAVFPSKGAVKGTTIYRILIKLLIALEAVGCRVLSTVCDGAQTNVTLWNMCGIYGYTDGKSKKVFENKMKHPSQNETPVYFLRDAPPLMKCLKNYLAQFPAVQVCINLNL